MLKAYIHSYNLITPLGLSVSENWQAVISGKSGIQQQHIPNVLPDPFFAAIIDEQKSGTDFPSEIITKLEKMLYLALLPVVKADPVQGRSLLILSSTKGNIELLEQLRVQEAHLSVLANKIAHFFGIKDALVVSNACVSGVMAVGTAKRLIQMEEIDSAYVIAGDVLTAFVVSGFQSFQALSDGVCRPYDRDRNGINIGEGAAACFISAEKENAVFEILGDANINDANHISGPSRTGEGLHRSIESAIAEAQIDRREIDFVSLHGTATLYNDEMEAIAMNRSQLQDIPCNSMKAYYGHTLGASGLIELILSMESAKKGTLIPSKGFENTGTTQEINVIRKAEEKQIDLILKTASGFGGSNSALILKKCTI